MFYTASFRDMDYARLVYRRLKDSYARRGSPADIKMQNKNITLPGSARPLLEQLAQKYNFRYTLERQES